MKIYGSSFNCSNGRSFINRLQQFFLHCYYSSNYHSSPLHLRQLLLRQLPAKLRNNKEADGSYTIGIGQFAEHGSLDNCREGFSWSCSRRHRRRKEFNCSL